MKRTIDDAMQYIDYIEGEVWKVIPNHSQYLISNMGRIFGFAHNAVKDIKKYEGHYYLNTRLCNDDGVFENSVSIHRLVAEAFCFNPDIIHKTQVHHKNGDSLDNRADNLEWLTPEEHQEKHRQMRAEKKRKGNEKK